MIKHYNCIHCILVHYVNLLFQTLSKVYWYTIFAYLSQIPEQAEINLEVPIYSVQSCSFLLLNHPPMSIDQNWDSKQQQRKQARIKRKAKFEVNGLGRYQIVHMNTGQASVLCYKIAVMAEPKPSGKPPSHKLTAEYTCLYGICSCYNTYGHKNSFLCFYAKCFHIWIFGVSYF